jgi:hypothetical protein
MMPIPNKVTVFFKPELKDEMKLSVSEDYVKIKLIDQFNKIDQSILQQAQQINGQKITIILDGIYEDDFNEYIKEKLLQVIPCEKKLNFDGKKVSKRMEGDLEIPTYEATFIVSMKSKKKEYMFPFF